MITATLYRNHLMPSDRQTITAEPGTSLRVLTRQLCAADEWPQPTVALVNGDPWMRERWAEPIPDLAVVEFRSLPQGNPRTTGMVMGGLMVVAGIATMVATGWTGVGIAAGAGLIIGGLGTMYGASQIVAPPSVPNYLASDAGSPTYSIDLQQNRKRIGEPIPVLYGRHRLMPDLVAQSYAWFDADAQYVAAVLCLGIGEFDVDGDSLRFGEAPFSELIGVEYAVIPPGGSLALFRDHVTTSQAVSGQTLSGPSSPMDLIGAPLCYFASANVLGTDVMTIYCDTPIFAGVSPGDTIIIGGTANYNGTFTPATASPNLLWFTPAGGFTPVASESPWTATVTKSPSTPLMHLDHATNFCTFTASTKRIAFGAGIGYFAGAEPGDIITVAGSVSNNGYVTVQTVGPDDSYITVIGTVVDETTYEARFSVEGSGYIGWFEAGAPTDDIDTIAVDLVAPRGLGTLNGSGGVDSRSITVEIQYQGVNNDGTPGGSLTTESITVTGAQQKARRVTHAWTNATGFPRVRCRGRRTTTPSTNTAALDEITWTGLKGYMPDVVTYPGVTILAVKAKASEQLTTQQMSQVNLVAQRKIPVWSGSAWSSPTATSSIAWALADALRDDVYGAGLADDEIDLAALLDLDATWAGRGDEFNAVFDQSLTTWEAVQKIANAGRAQPVLAGGVVTFVRDEARALRTAMFTPANMLPGSLAIEYRLPQEGSPDGTSVSWINPATWKAAHIEYREGGGAILNPQALDLFGVTDEDQATRAAVYLDRVRKYQRKQIRWATEMDGHLVSVGDRVALSHDVPAWGQSGELLDITGSTFASSQPLTWTTGATHSVLLRRPDGSVAGPYTVTAYADDPYRFTCTATLDFTPRTDLSNGDRTLFQFGPSTSYTQDVVIVSVSPRDSVTVDIEAVPYDERIHAAGA